MSHCTPLWLQLPTGPDSNCRKKSPVGLRTNRTFWVDPAVAGNEMDERTLHDPPEPEYVPQLNVIVPTGIEIW